MGLPWSEADVRRLLAKRRRNPGQRPSATTKAREMTKLEADYASFLELAKRGDGCLDWRYEPVKFRLADRTYYTPDFMVVMPDGEIQFHETKGFWRDDARVKFKVVAELFPMFTWIAVTRKNHEWSIEVYRNANWKEKR